jgi:hypothetical protein
MPMISPASSPMTTITGMLRLGPARRVDCPGIARDDVALRKIAPGIALSINLADLNLLAGSNDASEVFLLERRFLFSTKTNTKA